jgi:hypothetical protein
LHTTLKALLCVGRLRFPFGSLVAIPYLHYATRSGVLMSNLKQPDNHLMASITPSM